MTSPDSDAMSPLHMRKNKKSRIKVNPADDAETTPAVAGDAPANNSEAAGDGESVVEVLRKELEEAKDSLLRARAEAQNVRKRSAQEVIEAKRYANANLIRNLLGVLDDFDRTLEHSDGPENDALGKGVRLIYDNLHKVLADHCVEVIDPKDEPFDPRYHEAMLQQPAPDKTPGSVIQVVQRGYRLEGRVLRPAKVIIASQPEQTPETPAGESPDSEETVTGTVQE